MYEFGKTKNNGLTVLSVRETRGNRHSNVVVVGGYSSTTSEDSNLATVTKF